LYLPVNDEALQRNWTAQSLAVQGLLSTVATPKDDSSVNKLQEVIVRYSWGAYSRVETPEFGTRALRQKGAVRIVHCL
jgi:hypothetical protein